jgi:hypothetical protein
LFNVVSIEADDNIDDLPILTANQIAFVHALVKGKTASDTYKEAYDCEVPGIVTTVSCPKTSTFSFGVLNQSRIVKLSRKPHTKRQVHLVPVRLTASVAVPACLAISRLCTATIKASSIIATARFVAK